MNTLKEISKIFIVAMVLIFTALTIGACSAADVASQNLSTDADNFKINRRIVFYNGITDKYILVIEGRCSFGNADPAGEISVTCKTGESSFKKHFLGLSDNVTYFSEQIEPSIVDAYHYKVIFRPETVLPDIDIQIQ